MYGPQDVTLPQAYAVLQLVSPTGAKRLFDAIVPLQRSFHPRLFARMRVAATERALYALVEYP